MSLSSAYPEHYEINKDSPYYRELIPKEMFEALFEKAKMMAIGYMCQIDPSNAELYKTKFPTIFPELEAPFFKQGLYEMFAGCYNPESTNFKFIMKSVIGKIVAYGRFCLERNLYQDELNQIPIKNPIYILALPRSGSTFTHTILGCDKKAKTVKLYEHLCAGSRTMSKEARMNMTASIIGQVTTEGKDLNKCHNMDDVMSPEEELFFMECLTHSYIFGTSLPRWEQFRKSSFERNFDKVYEAVLCEMRMSAIEYPIPENGYFLMKCVSHFMTPIPFFNIMCADEIEPRIVWIHREPVDEYKSAYYLMLNARLKYVDDLGLEDYKWLQENILRMNEIVLKNAIAIREQWIAEKPERAKQICDIGFKEMIADPVKVTQRIYDQFGLVVTEELKKEIVRTKEEGDPQKGHGRKEKSDDEFFISDAEVRERFKWYHEKFGQYMPSYWGN